MTDGDIGTVAIIGLGLIGGSLARDLAARGVRTLGFDRDAVALRRAQDAGAIAAPLDAALTDLADADVLVVAVPVAAAAAVLAAAAPHVGRARLITDVGSTKMGIAAAAQQAGVGDRFVGGHPLAGDDRAGWDASRAGLFEGARVFLCAGRETGEAAILLANELWHRLGARTEHMDAAAHDRMLAWTSHLPQTLATALALTLENAGYRFADLGSGGRGMTRLAASAPSMWAGIAAENGPRLAEALDGLDAVLAAVRPALQISDRARLDTFFRAGRGWAAVGANRDGAAREEDECEAHGGSHAGAVVAFQGEFGAHSEAAVRSYFPAAVRTLPCRDFQELREAVLSGRAQYGLLPVENSSAGSIVAAYDILARPGLAVLGEVVRPIRHALLGVPGSALARVRRVLSHPVALAQCTGFLGARRWLEAVAFYDTAGAALEVARAGDPAVAAVAARDAASRYGLEVLADDIHDRADNRTRFVVIARPETPVPVDAMRGAGSVKSALFLDVANRPGALSEALLPFARRGVNLTHIQSTPGDAPWTYRFIIEIAADAETGEAARAIAETRAAGAELRVLGRYTALDSTPATGGPASDTVVHG